tara:strand:- start:843 stop:1691 length:849 start_codon:yes stop_codon:yes gene_type:complete
MSNNPLSKHFRQPRLFIKLPSGGNWYPRGSLEMTETGEFPVLAMTAKDEIMFKTPDALLNGQSTVSVIQSCIPNIKNAWHIPSIDLDAILLAIRIATYGEKMDLNITVPNTDEERSWEIDLRTVLDQINSAEYNNVARFGDFSFEFAPISYKYFTETALKTFEEQRILRIVNDDTMSETEKVQKFTETFKRLTELNISTVLKSVVAIQYLEDEVVSDPKHIAEFFENTDKELYKNVIEHIDTQRQKFSIQPQTVRLPQEDVDKGAPETIEIPITFDQSNFFA